MRNMLVWQALEYQIEDPDFESRSRLGLKGKKKLLKFGFMPSCSNPFDEAASELTVYLIKLELALIEMVAYKYVSTVGHLFQPVHVHARLRPEPVTGWPTATYLNGNASV